MSELDVTRIPAGPERVRELTGTDGKTDEAARRELARRRRGKKAWPAPDGDVEEESDHLEPWDPNGAGETRGRHVDRRA